MQIGSVYVKIVTRRLQQHSKAFQYMLLAGFDPKLSHRTAVYVETLPPSEDVSEDEVLQAIEKARIANNATSVIDVTNGAVLNKLNKIFDAQANTASLEAALVAFEGAHSDTFQKLGIGQYL